MSLGCPAWLSFLLCLAFGCHQATESPVPEKQNQAASGSTWADAVRHFRDGQLPLALGNYRKAFRALKSLPPAESSPELELDRERARWELADRLRSLYDQTPQP